MMSTGLAKMPQSAAAPDPAQPASGVQDKVASAVHDQQHRLELAFPRPVADAFFARFAVLNLMHLDHGCAHADSEHRNQYA